MTEPQANGEPGEDAASGAPGGLARWQKVAAVVGLLVVVVLVMLLVTGDHGPGRHAPDGALGQSADVTGGGEDDSSRPSYS